MTPEARHVRDLILAALCLIGGAALVTLHILAPQTGHDVLLVGVGLLLVGLLLWGHEWFGHFTRTDLLGGVFMVTGAFVLLDRWHRNALESWVSLAALGAMVFGAHYISTSATQAALKDVVTYTLPWWRRANGADGRAAGPPKGPEP